MKRNLCLLLAFLLLCPVLTAAIQTTPSPQLRIPRNADKLITRAQAFWAAMVAGQKLKALEFVPPDKKELFLDRNSSPLFDAKVLGLDLTEDLARAKVRVDVGVLSTELPKGRARLVISDTWVWRNNDWFLDVAEAIAVFGTGPKVDESVAQVQKQIDAALKLVADSVDLGTIVQGEFLRKEIPVEYNADLPLALESSLAPELLSVVEPSGDGITSQSKHFFLLVSSQNWQGPFSIPLPIRFRHGASFVERVLTVKGSVFAPVAFRQLPAAGPTRAGELVSVFVKNNTDTPVPVRSIAVDGQFDVLAQPSKLGPQEEFEIKLRLRPDAMPDRLVVVLDAPFYGRESYYYRFRTGR